MASQRTQLQCGLGLAGSLGFNYAKRLVTAFQEGQGKDMQSMYVIPLTKLVMPADVQSQDSFEGAVFSVEFGSFRNVGSLLSALLCVLAAGLWQYRWTLKCKSPGR